MLERYPDRRLVVLPANEAERRGVAAQHATEHAARKKEKDYHPAAVAHFAGVWLDEDEEGKGNSQVGRALWGEEGLREGGRGGVVVVGWGGVCVWGGASRGVGASC